ncbi:hypothetical protein AB833_28025 [Chromatiales bacterium (ex Bugula neritina AB1)]|nr:hypothetical protein AB833_28025 [Chromatiales bacterium (ex Bugula neritina AB1)]
MAPVLPEQIETDRLILRKPQLEDAAEIYSGFASVAEATKYMSWPRHTSIKVTEEVVSGWLKQWQGPTGGALLITDAATGSILGSTGIDLENPLVGST